MTEKEEKEILERLLNLSDEEWQPEWGEPERPHYVIKLGERVELV